MSNSLLVAKGKEQGKKYVLTDGEFFIGRDSNNYICVPDIEVSRRHCSISRESDGRCLLTDLASSNGTFVNGSRVSRCQLNGDDRIRVGSTEIIFQQEPDSGLTEIEFTERPAVDLEQSSLPTGSKNGSKAVSALSEDSTYYELTGDEVEASRRFVQVGNDLRFIYHASLATSRQTDCGGMLRELLDLIFNWIAADRGCVFLREHTGSGYRREVFKSRTEQQEGFRASESIIQYVSDNKVGVLSTEASSDKRWGAQLSMLEMNVGEVMCVPIQGREEVLGLIYLDTLKYPGSRKRMPRFNEDNLKLLVAMAHQAAVAIENEAYYQALVEKERLAAIGETTNVIAHHVKNTIQGIHGGAHLIESGLKLRDLEVIEKGWLIVNRNQERISRLVIDMLVLGRPYEPVLETVDLNAAVEDAIEKLEFQFSQQETTCEFNPNRSLKPFRFDFAGLSSAVFHLISCSLLACRDAKTASISVSIVENSGFAEVVIEDDGDAIDVAAQEIGITPFGIGTDLKMYGIGLAVSRKIVSSHQGEIRLSHPNGKGNRFVIEIPILES